MVGWEAYLLAQIMYLFGNTVGLCSISVRGSFTNYCSYLGVETFFPKIQ